MDQSIDSSSVTIKSDPDPTSPISIKNNHKNQFVDLGYDSLHSTPRQQQAQPIDPSSESRMATGGGEMILDDDEDEEDNLSGRSVGGLSFNIRRATRKLFKFSRLSNDSRKKRNTDDNYHDAGSATDETKTMISLHDDCSKAIVARTKIDNMNTNNNSDDDKRLFSDQEMTHPTDGPVAEQREQWDKKIDFLLSIIGFAVDLANVWRFPYLCYKNGGGVFLIPYTLMLIFGALPLFFLELSLGQFAKSGPITVWDKIYPAAKGVGYCAVLISWYVSFYYNVIIAWAIYYIINTVTAGDLMPWQHCNNEWNTRNCVAVNKLINCINCTNSTKPTNQSTSAQEFFERKLLQLNLSRGFNELGGLRPEMVGCVTITFILLYFSLFKGVKSSGKVVWVTATAPYVILTILLARGVFLPGAAEGVVYYLNPRLEKLKQPGVWTEAAVQVFYSIGVGFGVHLTYASFNKFNNNCYRDALITTCVNSFTSFYSGFVIFIYLGYMAKGLQTDISTVAKEGYGLVFQVYPEAISTLPMAKLWSVLFFLMLVTLGLDSAMGGLEAVITGIIDEWKIKRISRETLTAIVLSASFLASLVNCTQGGGYTMVWFDSYAAAVSLLCSALFEALAIAYGYGIEKFTDDIESMLGFRPAVFWPICWKFVSPLFLMTIIFFSITQPEPIIFMNYRFPTMAYVLGWIFGLSSVLPVPVIGLFYFARHVLFKSSGPGANTVVNDREVIALPLQSATYI